MSVRPGRYTILTGMGGSPALTFSNGSISITPASQTVWELRPLEDRKFYIVPVENGPPSWVGLSADGSSKTVSVSQLNDSQNLQWFVDVLPSPPIFPPTQFCRIRSVGVQGFSLAHVDDKVSMVPDDQTEDQRWGLQPRDEE